MPIHKVRMPDGSVGYQWGRTGKKYKNLEDARRQERAIYASGWREGDQDKKATYTGENGMNYEEWTKTAAPNIGGIAAAGAAGRALTLAALLHGVIKKNRVTGTIGGAMLGSGIGAGLVGGTAEALSGGRLLSMNPNDAGAWGGAAGALAGAIGGGSLGYILSSAAKKRQEEMENLEDARRQEDVVKTASLRKGAARQLAVVLKTAQIKNAAAGVQLPKAIQPTGGTGLTTTPQQTAASASPAPKPAAPALQQEPDIGGTRVVQPGDTGWKYWKELGGNRHMPYNKWLQAFQAANPGMAINKLKPGTTVGLGEGVE